MNNFGILYNRCLQGEGVETAQIFGKSDNQKYAQNMLQKLILKHTRYTVWNSSGRLHSKCLKERSKENFQIQEEDNSFRPGRSCIDGTFRHRQLTKKRKARKLETHMVFIVLQRAYHNVS